MRKFEPIEDRVVLKVKEVSGDTRIGDIIIPDTVAAAPGEGTVIAVGPGRMTTGGTLIPTRVKVGDLVVFGKSGYNTVEITDGINNYLVIRESELLTIVKEA